MTGCVSTASPISVTVNALPTPVITGAASACNGTTGSIYSTPLVAGHTYVWAVTGGTITAGAGTNSITVTWNVVGAGTVNVTETITATTCSAAAPQRTVTVNANPTITLGANPAVCAGVTSANLTYSATTGTPNQYSIVYSAAAITAGFVNVTNAVLPVSPITLVVPAAAPAAVYTANLIVTNSVTGCVSTASPISVTVNALPTPVITGAASACNGTTGSIYSTPLVAGHTYVWAVTGGTITAGAGTNSITVTWNVVGAGTVNVTETITATTCSAAAPQRTVTVNANPTITLGANPAVCAGVTSANLTYSATTGTPNQYSIVYSAAAITAGFVNVTNAVLPVSPITLVVPAAAPAAVYTANLIVTNSVTGCVSTASPISVTVNALPTPVITGAASACNGTTGSIYSTPLVAGHTYVWAVTGGTITAGAGTNSITVTWNVVGAGTVNVTETITATTCSAAAPQRTVTVNSLPLQTFTAQPGATACANTDVTYTTQPGQTNYVWTYPGVAGIDYTITSGGTINDNTVTLRWLTPGSKTVGINYTNAFGCSGAAPVFSTPTMVSSLPTISDAGPDQTGAATCGLTTVTLAANAPVIGTGSWSIIGGAGGSITAVNSPTSTFTGVAGTTYVLRWTISNAPCTPSTDDVNIAFNQDPTISNAGLDQTDPAMCGVTMTTLTGNSPAIGTGTWTIIGGAGGNIAAPNNPTSTFTGIAGTAYTLRWTINNAPCAPSMDDVNITFNVLPVATATNNGPICAGTTLTLTGPAGMTTYSWTGPLGYTSTSQSPTVSTGATIGMAGVYSLIVTNASGCSSIAATTTVVVNALPTISVSTAANCSADLLTYSVGVTVSSGIVTSTSGTVVNIGGNIWSVNSIPSGTNITMTVTDGNGCVNDLSITAPVCSCPVVTAPVSGGDMQYCSGGTIPTINATILAGETIDWYSLPTGGTLLQGSSLNYTPSSPGVYYAEARNTTSNCTSSSRTPITVTLNALPVPTFVLQPGAFACLGTDVTYTTQIGQSGYTWTFTGLNGIDYTITSGGTVTDNTVTLKWTSVGIKTVSINYTNPNGCTSATATSSTPTTINIPPGITGQPVNQVTCSGTAVSFTVTATGTGINYQWRKDGVNILGATASTYSIATPVSGDAGNYDVVVSGTCLPDAISSIATLTVDPLLPVSVTIVADANPVCAGTTVTFTATPTNGGAAPSYQWKVNGVNAGINSDTYAYIPVNGDIVTVDLTSNAVCATGSPATSAPVTMTVDPLLPVSVTIVADANPVCAGTTVTFTATPTNGGAAPSYQWKVNGVNAGINSDTYAYIPVNGDIVTVDLTSNAVCATGSPATSAPVTMTVDPLLPVSVTIVADANPVCAGTTVTFTATPTNGGAAPSYQWKVNGVNAGINSDTYAYIPVNGDIVTVDLTSNAVCATGSPATSAPVTMTVDPLLPVSVTIVADANPVCDGTTVTFTATPTNGGAAPSYQWKVNGVNAGINSDTYAYIPVNGDIVTVDLTSNAVCATGSPATSAPVTMTVDPLLPVSVTIVADANPVCDGTTVTFTATPTNGGAAPSYQWKVNGVNAGINSDTYAYIPVNGDIVTVDLTSNAVCATGSPATSAPVTMTVDPLLPVSVTIVADANPVCDGTTVTFTATPTNGGAAPSYQWKVNGVNAGINSDTYAYIPVNGDIVTVDLTSNAVCATGSPATSAPVTMTVDPLLPVSVTIVADANPVCDGTTVTFTATPTNGGAAPSYQWKVNGVNAGINSDTYAYIPVNGDIVTVDLTSNAVCATGSPATSAPVTMTVDPLLPVSVTIVADANPVCDGTTVTFTATPTNGGAAPSYQWKVNGVNAGINSDTYAYIPVNGDIVTVDLTSNAVCATGSPATSAPVTMTVDPLLPVSVTIVADANPVCDGTTVTFTATPTNGGAAPSYQWKVNGVNAGINSDTYAYIPVNGDIVTVDLTSNAVCATGSPATSAPVTMTVDPLLPVSVTIVADANPVCARHDGNLYRHPDKRRSSTVLPVESKWRQRRNKQ